MRFRICDKDIFCKDCKDSECLRAGDRGADCPKWVCDNSEPLECDKCEFLKEWYREMERSKSDEMHSEN